MMVGQNWNEISDPSVKMLFISIFQTGWFIESMWTQTLVIHMIRTPKIPFIQSKASWQVFTLTFAGIVLLTIIPYTPLAKTLGLTALTPYYFIALAVIILCYIGLVTLVKKIYTKKYKDLL